MSIKEMKRCGFGYLDEQWTEPLALVFESNEGGDATCSLCFHSCVRYVRVARADNESTFHLICRDCVRNMGDVLLLWGVGR